MCKNAWSYRATKSTSERSFICSLKRKRNPDICTEQASQDDRKGCVPKHRAITNDIEPTAREPWIPLCMFSALAEQKAHLCDAEDSLTLKRHCALVVLLCQLL